MVLLVINSGILPHAKFIMFKLWNSSPVMFIMFKLWNSSAWNVCCVTNSTCANNQANFFVEDTGKTTAWWYMC